MKYMINELTEHETTFEDFHSPCMNNEKRATHENNEDSISKTYFDSVFQVFQLNLLCSISSALQIGLSNILTQLSFQIQYGNKQLQNSIVIQNLSYLQNTALTESMITNKNSSSSALSKDGIESNENSNERKVLRNDKIQIPHVSSIATILKYWYEGDNEDGLLIPISSLLPEEKKKIKGMDQKYS